MSGKVTVDIDAKNRLVVVSARKELEVTPTVIPIPFAEWLDITRGVLAVEVEREAVSRKAQAVKRTLITPVDP